MVKPKYGLMIEGECMQHNKDAYAKAWQALAQAVACKQKERALGIYRLLTRSFDNKAVAMQLEGDILLAFDDKKRALEKYTQAMHRYQTQDDAIKARLVGEHIALLQK